MTVITAPTLAVAVAMGAAVPPVAAVAAPAPTTSAFPVAFAIFLAVSSSGLARLGVYVGFAVVLL